MSVIPQRRMPWQESEGTALVVHRPEPWSSAGGVLSSETLTDAKIVRLWLSRFENKHTRESYQRTATVFLKAVGPLNRLTIEKTMEWRNALTGAPATIMQRVSAVKSLLTFTHGFGVHPVNMGRMLAFPKLKNTLAEKIMTREHVLAMIQAARGHARDHALLRVLYLTGCRVSELIGLCWKDVQHRGDGSLQLALFGKGGKTRYVLLDNPETCKAILAIRHGRGDDEAVFESRTGNGHLDRVSVNRLIRKWAKAAGLPPELVGKVSCHWFRHAHASHALDLGAPIHEVQQTLGHTDISTTGRYLHIRPGKSSARFLAI